MKGGCIETNKKDERKYILSSSSIWESIPAHVPLMRNERPISHQVMVEVLLCLRLKFLS